MRQHHITITCLVMIALLPLAGCGKRSSGTSTPEGTVKAFLEEVNKGNTASAKLFFSGQYAGGYDEHDQERLETIFPPGSLGTITVKDLKVVGERATLTVTIERIKAEPYTTRLWMVKKGGDWKIDYDGHNWPFKNVSQKSNPERMIAQLPPDMAIEDVVAEFDADPAVAEQKYANKRIIVVGKLVRQVGGPNEPFEKRGKVTIYYELARGKEGNKRKVECRFYDTDEASSIQEGNSVRLSGVFKRVGPGKYMLDGAGDAP